MKYRVFIVMVVLVICCAGVHASAWDTTGLTKEWAGDATMRPYDIAILSNGSIWMTHESAGNGSLITLDYPTGTFMRYNASFSAHFHTLDAATDDTLWIADYSGSLVHFSPSALSFESYPIPALFPADPRPYGVNAAADGRIWFTCQSDPPCIGMYDPSADSWERYDLPEGADYPPGVPVEIDFESDGTVWFTIKKTDSGMANGGLGRIDPDSGDTTIWTDPEVFFGGSVPPRGGLRSPWGVIVTGHDPARVWFVDKTAALLVRFDEGDPPAVTWYDLMSDLLDSHFIARDPDGKIWLAAMGPNHIGVFNPTSESNTLFDLRSGMHPMGIAISPLGEVWWSEAGSYGTGTGAGRFIPFKDADRDGIDDSIDKSPRRSSKDFFDKQTKTNGTITDRGSQSLTITKATSPYGVRVIAGLFVLGRDPAIITVQCPDGLKESKASITVTQNDDFIVTCGRPLLVLRGPVSLSLRPRFPVFGRLFG